MSRYIPKIPKPTSSKEELEKALQLHDAMLLARNAEESLVAILEILRNELVPWPSIHDLGGETAAFEMARESLSLAKLENLTRDLSIWIVEHYYQPKSLAEVKDLKSGLRQGGFECLLRYLLNQEDDRQRDREYKLLASSIEGWIQFIWESDDAELTQALENDGVVTTGQFVSRLNENCYAADSLLDAVIGRLQQLALRA